MATRPISAGHRGARVDWRAAMKRAARRSSEIGGAIVLGLGFLYSQRGRVPGRVMPQ